MNSITSISIQSIPTSNSNEKCFAEPPMKFGTDIRSKIGYWRLRVTTSDWEGNILFY